MANMQDPGIDANEIYLVKRVNKRPQNSAGADNHPLYIMSKWPKGQALESSNAEIGLFLQTLIDGKCYCGKLSMFEMQKAADELNIAQTLFIGECRMALSADNQSDTVALFEFELVQENNKLLLTLTKQHLKLRLRYMEVELNDQSNNAAMLDALVSLVQYMPYSTQMQHANLVTEATPDMNLALERCVSAQQEMQRDMMSKFCLLLNSKKKKISDLQEQLDKLQADEKVNISKEPENKTDDDDNIFDADTEPMQTN